MSDEHSWPVRGMAVFRDAGEMAATIHDLWDRESAYAQAYGRAADMVIDQIRESEMGYERDPLLIPVAFLYRQAFELWLKILIRQSRDFLRVPQAKLLDHRLHKLWLDFKSLHADVCAEAHQSGGMPDFAAVDSCMKEFEMHDPKSESFRYARDAKGNPTLEGLKSADLDNLQSTARRLLNYFSAGRDWLSDLAHVKNEWESELRREYGSDMQAEFEAEMRREFESDMRREFEADMRAEYQGYY